MPDHSEAHRRKRLLFQSTHRGTKEADLIIGGFAHAHMASMSSETFAAFEALLAESDPDIMAWISEQEAPPQRHDNDVLKAIIQFKYALLNN
ncbi:MAG: succinate dehydrogenase assembly factor 2 [Rhodospirillaceae bacterium]|jgi:antitoxin CptB|nr:succinate dehydrogenase assembly factor 2 [Rhodospirillaceae bacterium]MBT5456554.1 succinate dehydrogenase assembly factor 2 [Rhodospirillaceae bacterium]